MMFLGIDFKLEPEEKAAVLKMFRGLVGMVLPGWFTALAGGCWLERRSLADFMKIRRILLRGKDSKQMIDFVHFCDENNLDLSDSVNVVASVIIIAAASGTNMPV